MLNRNGSILRDSCPNVNYRIVTASGFGEFINMPTTRIYRVTEDEKELLMEKLRRPGEKWAACFGRMADLAAGFSEDDVPRPDLRRVNHRFDFPDNVFETLKEKAAELDVPLIHLILITAQMMVDADRKGQPGK